MLNSSVLDAKAHCQWDRNQSKMLLMQLLYFVALIKPMLIIPIHKLDLCTIKPSKSYTPKIV